MDARYPRLLRATLYFIALVQIMLGIMFLLAPRETVHALGLAATPAWTNWLFGQMGARFIGFGVGMVLAARNLAQAAPWIRIMIFIQVVDWIVTVKALAAGAVSLPQVSTAPYFPILFIVLLLVAMPRALKRG